MTTLLRAPRECASWYWDLDEIVPPGIESALKAASNAVTVLRQFDLLTPVSLEYRWYVLDSGFTGVRSSLHGFTALDDPDLPGKLLASRPSGFPNAQISKVNVVGSGTWFDDEGKDRIEPQVVDLSVTTGRYGPSVTVSVHHDIWSWFDFSGRPHPEVQSRNAPRLANALCTLNSTFGVEAETGEPTYFGSAVGFGVSTPDADENGMGPNLSDKL
ncbi:hypothetical protein ABVG11_20190 [Streptomyces sp. HD1123-B1]|uniref:hypothetical protein n=1 Tax=Streptomyces huangiella TaxID=3228804 RepID=UPI003D7E0F6A